MFGEEGRGREWKKKKKKGKWEAVRISTRLVAAVMLCMRALWLGCRVSGREALSSAQGTGSTYIYDKMHQGEGPSIMLLLSVPREAKPGLPFIIPMMLAAVVVISVVFWVETVDQELE